MANVPIVLHKLYDPFTRQENETWKNFKLRVSIFWKRRHFETETKSDSTTASFSVSKCYSSTIITTILMHAS